MAGAYEFALSEWGLSHRALEAELTDELFVLYLDAATDRLSRDFKASVEQTRLGYIYAHNPDAYARWARDNAPKQLPLGDAALVAAIMRISDQFPGHVIRGTV